MSELKTDFSIENDTAIETLQVRDVLNHFEANQVTNSNVTDQGLTIQVSNQSHTNPGESTEVPSLNAENQKEIILISQMSLCHKVTQNFQHLSQVENYK